MRYIWQHKDWPLFQYEEEDVADLLYHFYEKLGHVTAAIKALPEKVQSDMVVDIMVAEAVKSSQIEGEVLSLPDVKSSIRNNLGLNKVEEKVGDKRAGGMGKLMTEVRKSSSDPLAEEALFDWHRMLFEGNSSLLVGGWRTHPEPMQVVSGGMGRERVHFEAPPSKEVPREMKKFIEWFNDTAPGGAKEIKRAPVRAALVHLYFETVHPFEDGNGRIGRVLAEKALSQSVGRPVLLSLSRTIEAEKGAYYTALETAQRDNGLMDWLTYFVGVVVAAQEEAVAQVDYSLKKAGFFQRFKTVLNERQHAVIQRMMDEGPGGFRGGMNARKYVGITKTSKATATRDMQDLVEKGIFLPVGGGRSARYELVL